MMFVGPALGRSWGWSWIRKRIIYQVGFRIRLSRRECGCRRGCRCCYGCWCRCEDLGCCCRRFRLLRFMVEGGGAYDADNRCAKHCSEPGIFPLRRGRDSFRRSGLNLLLRQPPGVFSDPGHLCYSRGVIELQILVDLIGLCDISRKERMIGIDLCPAGGAFNLNHFLDDFTSVTWAFINIVERPEPVAMREITFSPEAAELLTRKFGPLPEPERRKS